MNARFVFNQEFIDLKGTLRTLPEELVVEADHLVEAAANAAAADIKESYPVYTGNLRDHVFSDRLSRGQFVASWIVKNTAKHAYIFENGTEARHTDLGANRGKMPPGHVFIPRVIKWRRRMNQQIRELEIRKGLVVTGDA